MRRYILSGIIGGLTVLGAAYIVDWWDLRQHDKKHRR